jgi:hypothetical protein
MATPKKKAINLNSLLMGADDKAKASPLTGIKKSSMMGALADFDMVKPKEDSKIVSTENHKSSPNKIAQGLSKLFDKAEENKKMEADNSARVVPLIPLRSSFESKRPKTALPTGRAKRASGFLKQQTKGESDEESESSSSSSSSSEDKSNEKQFSSKSINKNGDCESAQVMHTKNAPRKKGRWFQSTKLLEVSHNHKPITTPKITKRSLLIPKGVDSEGNLKDVVIPITQPGKGKSKPKKKVEKPPAATVFNKRQSLLMTPSQSIGHSRKLLQMKTIGVANTITDSKVKEEHDVRNMKPSSEFFNRLNYVHQLKEDKQGMQAWSKSFCEAINEVKIENKEYLHDIDPKFQRQFAKIPGLQKKTIVFGLDGVLVKTNFEKEGEDWKPTTLTLNESTGNKIKIYVSIRPYVINTLKQLRRAGCELILYSSSQYNYTSAILDVLLKHRIEFHHIICAEDHENSLNPDGKLAKRNISTKNMNLLLHNRKERDIIIVDCKVQGFAYKITNGIFVPPYDGPPNDKNPNSDDYFVYLFEYLKDFNDVFDVRMKIEKDFDLK